jgi:predicted N-acetyltransferase YhbS
VADPAAAALKAQAGIAVGKVKGELMIRYRLGNDLDMERVRDLYIASTLGQRRPIDEAARMAAMVANANLVVTAWEGEQLVGIARSLTDFVYVTYLADLAVRQSHQRAGIGLELIQHTRNAAPRAMIVLLAAPAAEGYYPHIGFTPHSSAWILRPEEPLCGPETADDGAARTANG